MGDVINMAEWKREKAGQGIIMAIDGITRHIAQMVVDGLSLEEARNEAINGFAAGMVSAGEEIEIATDFAAAIVVAAMINYRELAINSINSD